MAETSNGKTKAEKDTSTNGSSTSLEKQNNSKQNATFSERLDEFLFSQISIAPLVYYRICFGGIMLWEVTRYLNSDWIPRFYIGNAVYFKYFLWEWMPGPLPGQWMYIFYLWMGVIYMFFILGLWYRVTSVLAFLGFFYWFNLDITQHLNHFYLVSLLSLLNMFLPLHRNVSLDVIRQPELRVAKVPAWTLHALVFLLSCPYFFGGVAKINADWLQGEPIRGWILDMFPKGHYLTAPWTAYFFALGGMLYDLLVSPMLLFKPTRLVAIAATIFFHISNDNMFTIGIFPWFMLFTTPLYFPEYLNFIFQAERVFCEPKTTTQTFETPKSRRPQVKYLLGLFVAYNCYMPFRHHWYPGNSGWTEEGHLYAWHMKLRSKKGGADFTIQYADGTNKTINNENYLTVRQNARMAKRPLALIQFGHFLCEVEGKKADKKGKGPVEVYVNNEVSMNGRRAQHCVDPKANLCEAKMTWGASDWILPLEIPLWDKSLAHLRERIRKRKGKFFVGHTVAELVDGESVDGTISSGVLRFGQVTKYSKSSQSWTVKFDDDGDVKEFDISALARSQRRVLQYENGAVGPNVIIKKSSSSGDEDKGDL